MEVFEAIYQRRSIRKYTDQPVSQGLIQELLGAAMRLPVPVTPNPGSSS